MDIYLPIAEVSVDVFVLLGALGSLMMFESIHAQLRLNRPGVQRRKLHHHNWMHGLPLKARFRRSKLYLSLIHI